MAVSAARSEVKGRLLKSASKNLRPAKTASWNPQDFVQIKGRGTRKFSFEYKQRTPSGDTERIEKPKERFKLFDFFANCEYFEHKFKYDEEITLPPIGAGEETGGEGPPPVHLPDYESVRPDPLKTLVESPVGLDGMRIDREFFGKFEQTVKKDTFVAQRSSRAILRQQKIISFKIYSKNPRISSI
jgi:type I restriction enzyme, R subunit